MRSIVRNNMKVIAAVLTTAVVLGGGPSVARMVFDAKNANKVDGLHAKKYNVKAKKRRNKLIATNKKGFLPNNIIKVARNSAKLAGIGPTGFWRKTDAVNATTLGGLPVNGFALAAHNHDAAYAALGHTHPAAEIEPIVLAMDDIDAATLDGIDSLGFSQTGHTHSAADIATGTLDDARVGSAVARDAEVFGIVLAADGSGSGLDADTLDGINSGAFALDTDLADYYTMTEADNEFYNVDEKVGDADTLDTLDSSAFVQNSGDVLISAAPGAWQTPFTVAPVTGAVDPAITYNATGVTFAKTALTPQTFSLYPEIPAALYGKRMLFKGVELCYDANDVPAGVSITTATANVVSQDGAGAATSTPFALFSGVGDANCDYTEFVSPVTLDVDDGVSVQLVASWATPAAPLSLGRVTFVLSPTVQNATAPT